MNLTAEELGMILVWNSCAVTEFGPNDEIEEAFIKRVEDAYDQAML